MFQGSPFDTPTVLSGRAECRIDHRRHRRAGREASEFVLDGWQWYAAIAFATAPATVFIVVVLLHEFGR